MGAEREKNRRSGSAVYAIVKTGGRQYRVAVGDTLQIGNLDGPPGGEVSFPALLLVDDGTITTDSATLASTPVTARIDSHGRGPKITIDKFKNKTGYHKRQGHRQQLTTVTVTGIGSAGDPDGSSGASAEGE
ncbi:MAG: 50S ribosomal protein L21 [Mycobacteriales bacterium]